MAQFILITFGQFEKFTTKEDFQLDKENFIHAKKTLLCYLLHEYTNYKFMKQEEFLQMDTVLKANINKENFNKKEFKEKIENGLQCFLNFFGLSYDLLSDEQKNELLTIDLTYKNCKKLFLKIINEYIKNMKEMWPDELGICYEEKGFISYCHLFKEAKIKKDNFLPFIRDYFLLDFANFPFGNYRDNKLFDKIRKEMEQIYPIFKEQYGKNRYLEKLLSYVEENNDYNFEITRKILDDYYDKKKKNESKYISLKQKED